MPTENPKISAYVPQTLFDRFKRFQEERGLTMSQATIALMSEYFGLEQTVKGSSLTTVGGITLERIEAIEAELKQLFSIVAQKNEDREILGESLKTTESSDHSETTNCVRLNNEGQIFSVSNLSSIEQRELPLDLSRIPLEIEVQEKILAKRLGVVNKYLPNVRKRCANDIERLDKWMKEHDPDGISWIYLQDKKKYTVSNDLSSELKSRLLEWLSKNSN